MPRLSSGLTWIIALAIGAFGWACCAWLLLQQKESQENWAELQRRLEDRAARHGLTERRFNARDAELSRHVAELESEIDELITAQSELAALEERRRQAHERLMAIETKKRAAEIATATLALRYEVMKSRHAASEIASPGERRRSKFPLDSPQPPATHAFREGLYAFGKLKVSGANLKVSEPEREAKGGISVTRQAVHARSADDRPTNAATRSIKTAFKRAEISPQSMSGMDWAEAQFALGQALAAEGRRRSGTRELKEAVLAFRAIVGEWSRETAPLKWARVQFELGRTLASLSRRSGDPSAREESIAALGNALDALVQAGESSRAAEAKRLLDEIAVNDRK